MRSLLTLVVALTTTFNFAFATENDREPSEEFAQISTRKIPEEELVLLQQARYQAMHAEDVDSDEDNVEQLSLLNKKAEFYIGSYWGAQHVATYFSPDGRIVELEDESQWLISIEDLAQSATWLSNDVILIHPNKDLFWKTTNYKLTNLGTQQSIHVDLIRGPKFNSYYTKFVSIVDLYTDSIYLNDGSRWDISWMDSSYLTYWLPNDVVIVGSNSGWFSSSSPNILINVSLNEYVSALRAY